MRGFGFGPGGSARQELLEKKRWRIYKTSSPSGMLRDESELPMLNDSLDGHGISVTL
jgi:hypothetical protein